MTNNPAQTSPRIAGLTFSTVSINGESAYVELAADVSEPAGAPPMAVEFSLADEFNTYKALAAVADGQAVSEMHLERASLWWPRHLGTPALYDLAASLFAAGKLLDSHSQRVGVRRIELVRPPDPDGFQAPVISINGREMICRWADWNPPLDTTARPTTQEYRDRIASIDADTLRVSGGGICEGDAFYSACDEIGMLVWLDFVIHTAADGRTLEQCRHDAARGPAARNHPCIAIIW